MLPNYFKVIIKIRRDVDLFHDDVLNYDNRLNRRSRTLTKYLFRTKIKYTANDMVFGVFDNQTTVYSNRNRKDYNNENYF